MSKLQGETHQVVQKILLNSGQAKMELLFRSEQEVLHNLMSHPVLRPKFTLVSILLDYRNIILQSD